MPRVVVLGVRGANSITSFSAWLSSRAATRTAITGTAPVDAAALVDADVLVLLDPQKSYSAAEASAIADVVARGGALLATAGYDDAADPTDFNSGVSALGVQATGSPLTGTVMGLGSHRITEGITSLPCEGGRALIAPIGADTIGLVDSMSIGVAFDHGQGRTMIWGDDFITYDLAWTTDVQAFWDAALTWVWPTQ